MNKIERVRSTLNGEKPDRIPASFWFHFPQEQARGKASVSAHLDYYHKVQPDFLKIMNEHPYQLDVPIKNPTDWRKIKPAPLDRDFFQDQLDEIKMITDKLGGECFTTTTIFNPFSSANHASDHLVTEHLKTDPESVNIGLKVIAESLQNFAQACLEAGADGIYFSAQGGESDRFDESTFLNYIKPHDLTVLKTVQDQGELNIIHICRDNIRLHHYVDYPGDVINWAATAKNNISLNDGKSLFNRTILGGLDNRGKIVNGSPEEIRQEVHDIIKSLGKQRLIIGADCTLPTDIPYENIRIAIEAAGNY